MRGTSRLVAVLVAVVVALLVQVTVLPQVAPLFTWHGVGPGPVLLVVVATALVTDPRLATLTGFGAGLLLDLAPPADHLAGRWALALLVVGYVVSRLAHDHQPVAPGPLELERATHGRPPWPVVLAAAAGGSFVGNSAFALSGVLLGDHAGGLGDLLRVVGIALVWDVAAALVVVPLTTWLFARLATPQQGVRLTPRAPRRTTAA